MTQKNISGKKGKIKKENIAHKMWVKGPKISDEDPGFGQISDSGSVPRTKKGIFIKFYYINVLIN